MRHSFHTFLILMTVAFATVVVSACDENTVYDSYAHTPINGWEKNDTLNYSVPPLRDSGSFEEIIGLRINRYYPFTSVSLVVEQRILPGFRFHRDTLRCQFLPDDNLRLLHLFIPEHRYYFLFHLVLLKHLNHFV